MINLDCLYERCPDCGHNTLDPFTKKCTRCVVVDLSKLPNWENIKAGLGDQE